MKKITKIMTLTLLTFCLFTMSTKEKTTNFYSKYMSSSALDLSQIKFSDAHASDDQVAFAVRFMYFLVAGPPDGVWPTDPSSGDQMSGPEWDDGVNFGFIGLINGILGPTALGGGLASGGITSCSDIPTTGSVEMSDEGGTFLMSFSSAQKAIPTGYSSAGDNFEKRVTVSLNGTNMMVAELTCSGDLKSGYILWDTSASGGDGKDFETFFQFNESSGLAKVDFYMVYDDDETPDGVDNGDEKMIMKFSTDDGDEFNIFMIRVAKSNDQSDGGYIGVHGSKSLQLADVHFIVDTPGTDLGDLNDTTDVTAASITMCIEFSTDSTSTECTSNGLAVDSNPAAPFFSNDTPAFNIAWVADFLTLSTLP